ncbi:FkbO/Hyg5 family chorismatase [Streptomyces europaeiscabiei]|uniref:FkbO/Hyg5 family chorismatase n=1 Tax=Streptomyces europaeiscabiei TaxID=146819 RepID=UPI002E15604C|nr:FkbO/Hyg5 family chorismatase [Streptomyces europaeiscabiei]
MNRDSIDSTFQFDGEDLAIPHGRHVLGRVVFGELAAGPALRDGVPEIGVHMASPGFDQFSEVWTTDAPAVGGEYRGLVYSHDGEYLFCVGRIPETGVYRDATREAYGAAFELMDLLGYPNLFRMWNFIGRINTDNAEGLEVYQDFCVGRAEAFEAKPDRVHCMPAATGIGSRSGGIAILMLAARTGITQNIENGRQVPAYAYPRLYGPKSPSFARATRQVPAGTSEEYGAVYVSGTASITGHRTRHAGDVKAQCALALENIAHLLGGANLARGGMRGGHDLKDLRRVKVYVRHAEHLPAIRAACADAFPPARVAYLNVDICRADLLVEIEGVVPAAG